MLHDQRTFRRIVCGVLTAVLMATLFGAMAADKLSYPFTTVTTDKVNMRRSASSNATVLERLPAGATVTVQGTSGNYYKVTYNNRTGYILKQYIDTSSDAVVTPEPTVQPTASGYPYETTTTDKVNLRAARRTNSEILRKIPAGAAITVKGLSIYDTWAAVTYNGVDGYVMTEFINLKKIVKVTPTPTAAPTLAPAEDTSVYETLSNGSAGEAVTSLQNALIQLGYLKGSADGKFGGATETAVLAFQNTNGYPLTGAADANLQAFIYYGSPKNSSGTKTKVTELAPVSGVSIRLNNTGALVTKVQTVLTELGYYTGSISGTYDKETRTAVVAFQKKNGLTADGVCGSKTQNLLLGGKGLSPNATPTPTPTPSPTPVPTFTTPSAKVERSSAYSADARLVQKRLKELGYFKGALDGKFGTVSIRALKAFQTANGLEADGIAGRDTNALLFSVNALAAGATPTPAPTATPAPIVTPAPTAMTPDTTETISLGSEGDNVRQLQERLQALGYYTTDADGVCRSADVAAVKAFQKKNGLTADGKAGYKTLSKLYSVSAVTYSGAIAGGTVDALTTLKRGMSGNDVHTMQSRLIELGYLPDGADDGYYGTNTAAAVIAFQRSNGLVRDGVAGTNTLSKLYSSTAVKAAAAATATPAPGTTAAPTVLKEGDISTAVKALQERLISLGYLSGKADGNFGAKTYLALKAFQKANGLAADGIAGAKTLTAINSSGAVGASATAAPVPTAQRVPTGTAPSAARVRYGMWYTTVRSLASKYPYATVYDYATGISWQVHMFSLGKHADCEPLTAADTANMNRAFGGTTWTPKPVWIVFADGSVYMASTHSYPHDVQHITDNNFPGHMCIHFPRTADQVAAIGVYATRHQSTIDAGWKVTQSLIR